jgi:DNA repair protein RadC
MIAKGNNTQKLDKYNSRKKKNIEEKTREANMCKSILSKKNRRKEFALYLASRNVLFS